jgi:hypothetical protein
MAKELEYHFTVQRLIAASVAGFGLVVALVVCAPNVQAQIHGTPASVTSIGFGGNFDRAPGTPASVTSLGPHGYAFQNQFPCCFKVQTPNLNSPAFGVHHRHHRASYPIGGAVYAVPYYTPVYIVEPGVDDTMEEPQPQPQEDYPAGPTVFDRRASGESRYAAEAALVERLRQELAAQPAPQPEAAPPAAESAPVSDQPQTVLVFRDGHQLEVQNYAIVGNMLYDLTPGHRGKIAISDLDVPATAKQNDDRGIDFQLPAGSEAN